MRLKLEKDHRGLLLRCWNRHYIETAYAVLGLRGPRMEIEFPSDWHEERRAWLRLGCGIVSVAFSFPWARVVPDEGQCSGPTYGFYFFGDALVLEWGKDTGRSSDPKKKKFIYMPWSWQHVRHDYLNADGSLHHPARQGEYDAPEETKERHPYRYWLRSGKLQERIATVNGEEREWRWRLLTRLPWPRFIRRTINVEFSDEVGERTGSWKGGTTGCGWDWKHGESMLDALRRMERERKFT